MSTSTTTEATIEADPNVPIIRITRDFAGDPGAAVPGAHRPRALRPLGRAGRHDHARSTTGTPATGGSWRYVAIRDDEEYGFRGCFHEVRPGPDRADLHLGGHARRRRAGDAASSRTSATAAPGCTRQSLCDSFEGRDAWLRQRHGGRRQRGLRQARQPARGRRGRSCPTAPPSCPRTRPSGTGWSPARSPTGCAAPATGTRPPRSTAGRPATSSATSSSGSRRSSRRASGIELPAAPRSTTTRSAPGRRTPTPCRPARRPGVGRRVFAHPHIGEMPLTEAIDRFYTADVFMHTWDLARATGQDDRLDPRVLRRAARRDGADGGGDASSGQYGPPVPVPDDADAQTRLLGFIGRDPQWRPSR